MTRARLEPVLSEMRARLVPLVREAQELGASTDLAGRIFPAAAQWELSRRILSAIGFDFERGRLDTSTHPFTEYAGADDVRLTGRVREDDLCAAVYTTLHEGGHGLYDQGFAREDRDTMLGDAPSMGMHEGQARLWENHIGRSPAFWQFLWPTLAELFPEGVAGLDARAFHRAVNAVRPSPTRVGADQMSYHLHIVMRYELEVALLSGDLKVADLPGAWNETSQKLLGITPKTDKEGVLQDVHWAEGMFGYFPAYTVGSLYAAQLVETYARDRNLEEEIRRGAFRRAARLAAPAHSPLWCDVDVGAIDDQRHRQGTGRRRVLPSLRRRGEIAARLSARRRLPSPHTASRWRPPNRRCVPC